MSNDLNSLEEKLKQFKATEKAMKGEPTAAEAENAENMNVGLRAGAELVTCIAAGPFIGWLLDSWLHTKPLFLIVFLFAGIGTAFFNVYRLTQNTGPYPKIKPLHNGQKQGKNPPVIIDDEDD